MKKLFKNKVIVLLFSMIIFSNCFSANEDKSGFLSNIRELKELSDIMDILNENYVGEKKIDKKILLQGAVKGMLESLDDPHSNYFTKSELESFKEDLKGTYVGVGMVVQKRVNEPLTVVSPIEDGPAFKVGVKPKDKIIAIDGEATYKLTSEESVKKLKGEPNTKVKVTVYREATKETKDIEIERAVVELKYVKHRMLDDKIGYLRLTQFGENVYPDVKKAMEDLQKNNMKALVFDLRSNPGGALDQAIKISSMFLKEGRVVSVKSKEGAEQVSNREGKYYGDFPLVILINGGSASASEIVAGAIKDNKRGILVGEKSFGKGSVQTLIPLPDGDGMKLTIAKYYTPSGISIHGKGIEPDVVVEEKEGYMLFDSMVTNIDEAGTKENKKEIIKEIKGEEEAEKYAQHKDVQLDTAVGILKGLLLNKENSK
ncbi:MULTISPECIES: S41 family peptidase [Fusobacterium]|jgi:carboxyl-terminal processing protease|uniref:C-terminal processing peptidase n=3 Tax=Fusobacterium ulcerans TaxID=861 RepID=H1PS09_9FUSO|nr:MULTISPECIES: S41 family peptidase [Fusobacterium]AVQ27344.1 S41 family peptidase [Fusobacterium ulcerans]EFS24524.1 C-terminal processing peptidase [Fusobacterium ulcerans ATCC 49185]EHO82269.1 C-terminal processing peptidase [Fusobacterium ulcerans 12-1B]MCB8565079.1 S41 family peptidase [Fusobacterium ulcerans]MCB8648992.1 S41 family peptidase [Fusobacterium ulcerans]